MDFFNIKNIAFTFIGYPLSYVELIGTVFGMYSVYWASKENIWTWLASVINVTAFFCLFYQVHLYADMFLQVYFLIVTIYGWYNWSKPVQENRISQISSQKLLLYIIILGVGTLLLGFLMSHIHEISPTIFSQAAAYPYPDAFTTTASIIAMMLLSRKQIENWIFWMMADLTGMYLYYLKDILFVAVEYGIFLIICIFGYLNWKKILTIESLSKDA